MTLFPPKTVSIFLLHLACIGVCSNGLAQSPGSKRRIELPASIEGYQTIDLYARVSGYIGDMAVDIGDEVVAGQQLVKIDVPELEAQVAQKQAALDLATAQLHQAEAAIDAAEAELASRRAVIQERQMELQQRTAELEYRSLETQRLEKLVASGTVNRELLDAAKNQTRAAQAQLDAGKARVETAKAIAAAGEALLRKAHADRDAAEARIQVAQADLQLARTMAEYAVITAPFDGVITKRWYDPGGLIQSADGNSGARPLLQLVHTKKLTIVAEASMSQAPSIKVGSPVVLSRVDGLADMEIQATVTRIARSLDKQSRMMRIEADIEPQEPRLMPGHFGYLTIELSDE